jgi:hypothetical protein
VRDWLEDVRSSARDMIEGYVPDEFPVFDRVWPALQAELLRWRGRPPSERAVRHYQKRSRSLLGAGVRTRGAELVTPVLVGILVAALLDVLASEGKMREEDIVSLISRHTRSFGPPHPTTATMARIQQAVAKLIRTEMPEPEGIAALPGAESSSAEEFEAITNEGQQLIAAQDLDATRDAAKTRCYILLDRTEERVYIDGRERKLEPRPRLCLEHLLVRRGRACSYRELHSDYGRQDPTRSQSDREKRRVVNQWVSKIMQAAGIDVRKAKKAGKPVPIENVLDSGYRWASTKSFCVLRPKRTQPS